LQRLFSTWQGRISKLCTETEALSLKEHYHLQKIDSLQRKKSDNELKIETPLEAGKQVA
jgi:hypothetical protein